MLQKKYRIMHNETFCQLVCHEKNFLKKLFVFFLTNFNSDKLNNNYKLKSKYIIRHHKNF